MCNFKLANAVVKNCLLRPCVGVCCSVCCSECGEKCCSVLQRVALYGIDVCVFGVMIRVVLMSVGLHLKCMCLVLQSLVLQCLVLQCGGA